MKHLYIILLVLPILIFGQTEQELKEQLNQKLSEVSNEMNKTCPMVIDECTTMMSTYGGMGMIMYNINFDTNCLTRLDMSSVSEWEIYQTISMKNSFCTDPTFQIFKDFGVKMIWKYWDVDGSFLTKIEFTVDDCQ